jgi:2-dehydropantoate 2-reductase
MKTNIIIAGIGAVGGYFGGLLAKHFHENEDVEINFFARGLHLEEIRNSGLKVIQGEHEFIATPTVATDNPSEMGVADFIIIATKSFDLETIVEQLKPCINRDTVILPLLNGVDSKERILSILPHNIVLDGCVYIVSRLKQAGVVENIGNIQTLYFGIDNVVNERLLLLESLLKEANIEATLSQNISTILWEKFVFISPTATATSYFDKCIGELIADNGNLEMATALIEEVKQIAKAKHAVIADDITEKTVNKLRSLPFEATSSMHSDYRSNKPANELESLTGYVVSEGQRYNLETPMYLKTYVALKGKNKVG